MADQISIKNCWPVTVSK